MNKKKESSEYEINDFTPEKYLEMETRIIELERIVKAQEQSLRAQDQVISKLLTRIEEQDRQITALNKFRKPYIIYSTCRDEYRLTNKRLF